MNSPYHVVTISSIIFLSYALTWLLSHISFLPKVFHRRFWNTVLLFAFFITGLIGLLLTLQVNLKFELPKLDTYMVWHVDAGIALALVSIFHIYWHWKYYINLLKPVQPNSKQKTENLQTELRETRYTSKETKAFTILLGFNTLVIQTLFLREFMVMFSGNELTIGIILFFWMTFTGLGALITNKNLNQNFRWEFIMPFLIIVAGLLIVATNFLRFKLFIPGVEIGLLQIIWFSALFLFPVCFLSGYLFPKLVGQFQLVTGKNKGNVIYSFETLGSVLGGLIFTFILGNHFRSLEVLAIMLVFNASIMGFTQNQFKSAKLSFIFISIIILLATTLFNLDKQIKQPLFLNQELISYRPSPFGDIAKTKQYEQINYLQNTDLLFNNQDVIKTEELVHYPMLQVKSPKNILVFGGNFPRIIEEIEKYDVSNIDFIENNPVLFQQWKNTDSLNFSFTVNLIKKDLRKFLKKSNSQYDAVILNLPPPSNLQSNRFYTVEFSGLISNHLAESGALCFNLPVVHNYLDDEQLKLFSTIYATVKQHFKHADFFISEGSYLLASQDTIHLNVGELADNKNLVNEYINLYYLDYWSMNQLNEDIKQQLISDARQNSDFKPVVFQQSIKSWLEKGNQKIGFWIIFGFLTLIAILSFFSYKQPKSALFLAGFSTSAIEIILIFIFQIIYGNVYQFVGLIIALFMLGITVGASDKFSIYLKLQSNNLRIIQLLISLVPLLIILFIYFFNATLTGFILVLLFSFITPLFTGWIFHFTTKSTEYPDSKLAGSNYFIDLLGSAIGAFLVSIFLLPQVGLLFTLLIICVINLLGLTKQKI